MIRENKTFTVAVGFASCSSKISNAQKRTYVTQESTDNKPDSHLRVRDNL